MNHLLDSQYLGLTLTNPLVSAASPLGGDIDSLLALQEGGIGAVVLPSLFEEQITHEEMQMHRVGELWANSFGEVSEGFLPALEDYNAGPSQYLAHVSRAKRELSVPVIASLNGTSRGGWIRYASMIQEAGADALELNIYLLAADPTESAIEVERGYLELVESVTAAIDIPVAVKIGPYFSSMANMAVRIAAAGARGLVLFNRFYQPDLDIDTLAVRPQIELSKAGDIRLPLRWTAIIRPHTNVSLAAATGAGRSEDVIKLLLVGADVVQMASALLRKGPDLVGRITNRLRAWMRENDYSSLDQLRGSMSHANSPDPASLERSNYMQTLASYSPRAEWR